MQGRCACRWEAGRLTLCRVDTVLMKRCQLLVAAREGRDMSRLGCGDLCFTNDRNNDVSLFGGAAGLYYGKSAPCNFGALRASKPLD